jgi:hypothetical protein
MRGSKLVLMMALVAACGGNADEVEQVELGSAVPTPANVAADSTSGAAPEAEAEIKDSSDAIQPLSRESYAWTSGGRDPFRPLISLERSGPEFPDLKLTGVIYSDSDPSASIAMFNENGSTRRHTVSPGDMIGRLYVVRILPGSVTMRMNDFGTVREQTYTLRASGDEQ